MKLFIYIQVAALFLCTFELRSQLQSNITYDAGTNIEVLSGADICADGIIINGVYSGTGTICSGPLPVELLSFEYSTVKNIVTLSWATASEINNSGFEVERALDNGAVEWQKIGFVQGSGTTNEPKEYSYEDKKLKAGTYKYRLKQVDYNNNSEYFELMYNVKIDPPGIFSIGQNYPNPSNPKSKIDYEIPVLGKVMIRLYNLLGQEVSNILDEIMEAGYYTAEFDGSNLASGVYFYRITLDGSFHDFTKTLKMVLIK